MKPKKSTLVMAALMSMVSGVVAVLGLVGVGVRPQPRQRVSPGGAVLARGVNGAARPRLAASYGKLPLSFEANTGQRDTAVRFLSRGRGYALFLTGDEAVLALQKPAVRCQESRASSNSRNSKLNAEIPGSLIPNLDAAVLNSKPLAPSPQSSPASVLRMKLVGANPAAKAVGADELPGKANYFIGNDPKKWRSNVPTFAKVKYHGVYPGVDLVYYGNQSGQLEYDFVVAPGADPSAISLAVDAARQPGSRKKAAASGQCKIDPNGDLVAHVDADDEVRFHKPLVYQEQESGVRSQE